MSEEGSCGDSSPLPPCARCGHPADWHRLDDSLNVSPTDPAAEFRCIGHDCTAPGPLTPCDVACPDYEEDGVLAESGTAEAFAKARESIRSMHRERVLCAHADRNGEGAHWRYADEPCEVGP